MDVFFPPPPRTPPIWLCFFGFPLNPPSSKTRRLPPNTLTHFVEVFSSGWLFPGLHPHPLAEVVKKQLAQLLHAVMVIGVLLRLICREIDGAGLDQLGHLFFQRVFQWLWGICQKGALGVCFDLPYRGPESYRRSICNSGSNSAHLPDAPGSA